MTLSRRSLGIGRTFSSEYVLIDFNLKENISCRHTFES
jgi:hypothetical protein